MHRLSHLLGHLQERLDQPRRHGIRLVQQRRDQAGHRLPEGLGEPDQWKGGWTRKRNGKIEPRIGGKWRILANIFANPDLPEIDDYYEPFTFDYEHLQKAPELEAFPTARPRSLITGERMEKIEWGPNWRKSSAASFSKRSKDANFEGIQKEIYGQFEKHLHDVSAEAVRALPQPGLRCRLPVRRHLQARGGRHCLIDQEKCRGWRMCVSGCPYKKIYYNWSSGKSREVHLLLPTHRGGPANGLLRNLRWPHPLSRRRDPL